jgi:hypothetical protein
MSELGKHFYKIHQVGAGGQDRFLGQAFRVRGHEGDTKLVTAAHVVFPRSGEQRELRGISKITSSMV